MANWRGKIAEIDLYLFFSSKRTRRLKGKVKNIHTRQSIKDNNSITIVVDGKEHHFPNQDEYFVINKVFEPKTGEQIGGRFGCELRR